MTLQITKELLRRIKKESLTLTSWAFLISLHTQNEIFDLDDISDYAFIAQQLGVLGFITLNGEDTDDLYCLTEKGKELIKELNN